MAGERVNVHGWHGNRLATAWEPMREGVSYGVQRRDPDGVCRLGRIDDMARVRALVERVLPGVFVIREEPDWCGLVVEPDAETVALRARVAALEEALENARKRLGAAGADRWIDAADAPREGT